MSFKHYFSETGTPCSEKQLRKIENQLSTTLPPTLRDLIKETGGGDLSFDFNWVIADHLEDPISIDQLYGYGKINSMDIGIDALNAELREDLDVPNGMLVIAEGESGFHELFLLNVSSPLGEPGAVFYWDSEVGDDPFLIASSFDDLLAHLGSDPDSDTTEASFQAYVAESDRHDRELMRSGELPGDLIELLKITNIPDAEALIRTGVHHAFEVSSKPRAINSLTANELMYLLVHLVSTVRPVQSCEDFLGERFVEHDRQQETGYPQFYSIMSFTFVPLQAFAPALEYWWKKAVEAGGIVERDGSFVVAEEALGVVLERLRHPETLSPTAPQQGSGGLWNRLVDKFRG